MMKAKQIFCIIGIIAGILLILSGAYLASGSTAGKFYYDYPDDAKFGGDFYTEQYQATRYAARNIAMVGTMIQATAQCSGIVIICFGLMTISIFSLKMINLKKDMEREISQSSLPPLEDSISKEDIL